MNLDLNNRIFKVLLNTKNGEVTDGTVFHYHHVSDLIWAEYSGGEILKGFLIGKMIGDSFFEFTYQHVNNSMEIMTGICNTHIQINNAEMIELHETWQWTCKDFSKGESILIEV